MSIDRIGTDRQQALAQLADASAPNAKSIAHLRQQFGRPWADRMLAAAALQHKARRKFGPGAWWVTEKSLQQATPWQVARIKAGWFGDRTVYDLCCGVGGDAMAIADRGPLVAVDSDPEIVALAAANLVNCNAAADVEVRCADVTQLKIPKDAGIHIDPDRRVADRRTSAPQQHSPPWPAVIDLISKVDCAVVKLAPAADLESDSLPLHRCWISLSGSVREQSLLRGQAIDAAGLQPNARSAMCVTHDATATRFAPDTSLVAASDPVSPTDQIGEVLVDPDPAIRAAGLTEAFARVHRFQPVGSAAGFLTGNLPSENVATLQALAVVGRVLWSGPCDDRKLRRELRARDGYPIAIKCRGSDHDPAALSKRYRNCGQTPVTLWIGRSGARVYAAITAHTTEPMAVRPRAPQ